MEEESKLVDWLENKFISSQNPLLLNSLFKNRKQFKKKKSTLKFKIQLNPDIFYIKKKNLKNRFTYLNLLTTRCLTHHPKNRKQFKKKKNEKR